MHRSLRAVILFLSGFFLFACGETEPSVPGPEPGQDPGPVVVDPDPDPAKTTVRGLQVNAETEKIDMPSTSLFVKEDINSDLISYDPENGLITFKDSETLRKADIKVGDVLYSMPVEGIAPRGYILKVTGIRNSDGRVVYEVEEAGIADAFNKIDTQIPLEMGRLTEDRVVVWDPFEQADQTDLIMNRAARMRTRSAVDIDWLSEWSIGKKWDDKRYSLKIGNEKTTLDIILFDFDEDFKTKRDQLLLTVTLSYDAEFGTFNYSFEKSTMVLGLDWTPNIGISAALTLFKGEAEGEADGQLKYLEEKRKVMSEVEQKLIGKRFCIASYSIPVGPASVFVEPRIEAYLLFKMGIDGELKVESGFEKFPVHFHVENVPYTSLTNYLKSGVTVEKTPEMYSKVDIDVDLEGKMGLSGGIFCVMPKIAKLITDKEDVDPSVGFFVDATVNGKASAKVERDVGKELSTINLHLEGYGEAEGYFKLYAHFQKDLIWEDKLSLVKIRYPKEESKKFQWDTTYVIKGKEPVPYAVAPENRAVVQDQIMTLQWDVPENDRAYGENGPYVDLLYTVYCDTDKSLVAQSSPRCRIVERTPEKSGRFVPEKNVTYYWKIVCVNAYGWEYESSIFCFDTGFDGKVVLNKALANYLNSHYGILEGVLIQEDGTILKTPSNLRALSAVTTLSITDPEGKYGISYMDDLLMLLPSLRDLNCSYNNIQSLYLVENPLLETLVCHDNPLHSLPLDYTPRLGALNCANNPQLKELDLPKCPDLSVLTCDHCGLESLDLRNNQKMMNLYASDCHLDFLDVSRCPNLLRLDFHAQHKERVKLRLTQGQKDRFALFRPHVNTDYEYVDLSGIQTSEATDITSTTAKVAVSVFDPGTYTALGIVYSHVTEVPTITSEYTNSIQVPDKMSGTFTLKDLKPDTRYYARGYARSKETGLFQYGNVIHFRTGKGDPEPKISITPDVIEFGEVPVGRSKSATVEISNIGDANLTYSIVGTNAGYFSVSPSDSRTLWPGESQTVTVTFSPRGTGEKNHDFVVKSNDPRGDTGFRAWGTGVEEFVPITDIVIDRHELVIGRGDYAQLNLVISPENYWGQSVMPDWSVDDESLIDSFNEYSLHLNSFGFRGAKAGTTTVSATVKVRDNRTDEITTFTDECTLVVKVYIERMIAVEAGDDWFWDTPIPKGMYVGEKQTFRVKYEPVDATETDMIWKSDDPSVASVSPAGMVTALKPGSTTIRCIVATEARGHIEVDWSLEVRHPSGSHEGLEGDNWD